MRVSLLRSGIFIIRVFFQVFREVLRQLQRRHPWREGLDFAGVNRVTFRLPAALRLRLRLVPGLSAAGSAFCYAGE